MNKGMQREDFSTRLSQISMRNRLIDADLNYKTKITNKIKKLNESNKRDLLPQIYAKANKLNKKLSMLHNQNNNATFYSNSFIAAGLTATQTDSSLSSGSSSNLMNDHATQSLFFENSNSKDLFLKSYNRTRKRSMIVSKHLDDDMKLRLEQMKTFGNRRLSNGSDQGDQKAKDALCSDSDELNELNANDGFMARSKDHKVSSSQSSMYNPLMKTRNPRFGSTLSKDAQFALMKSLEDTIVKEIEKHYPDMKDRVPRTTTAQFVKRKFLDSSMSNLSHTRSTTTNTYDNLTNVSCESSENLRYESTEFFSQNFEENGRAC